jgi:hypothetical protein
MAVRGREEFAPGRLSTRRVRRTVGVGAAWLEAFGGGDRERLSGGVAGGSTRTRRGARRAVDLSLLRKQRADDRRSLLRGMAANDVGRERGIRPRLVRAAPRVGRCVGGRTTPERRLTIPGNAAGVLDRGALCFGHRAAAAGGGASRWRRACSTKGVSSTRRGGGRAALESRSRGPRRGAAAGGGGADARVTAGDGRRGRSAACHDAARTAVRSRGRGPSAAGGNRAGSAATGGRRGRASAAGGCARRDYEPRLGASGGRSLGGSTGRSAL